MHPGSSHLLRTIQSFAVSTCHNPPPHLKAAAPAAALEHATFRDLASPLLAVDITNTYLKDALTESATGHMNNNTWHTQRLLLELLHYILLYKAQPAFPKPP